MAAVLYGLFRVHPLVSQALAENKPVVALESTIITHGMPYPHNLRTAKEVEAIVRKEGATPATVGVIEGEVRVGLTSEELEHLAQCTSSVKASRRDLPYVLSKRLSGGTTVSATMIAAHRAGVPVFVTGGIGGVHRDGENTLDISADLTELGRTPIAVVSAGVKYILDIGRTLEFLPATLSLDLGSGLLLAVPIPEEHAAAGQQIEEAIQAAVTEASLGRPTLEVCSSRLEESVATSPVRFYTIMSHVHGITLGLNVTACFFQDSLSRLGQRPLLISATGADSSSDAVFKHCQHMVSQFEKQLSSATLVCLDGNVPVTTINYVCSFGTKHNLNVPPNAADEVLATAVALSRPLLEHIHCLIVTLGAHGILVCGEHDGGSVNLQPRKQKRPGFSSSGMQTAVFEWGFWLQDSRWCHHTPSPRRSA
ncbi:unnamed protein product [Tetraodon nigroviridis]|uniref:Chromosome 13 SCAF15000, whole genome shotgun sequence n=1 Tax=Tetraodon nigroviridis TaxID=99883 RepID=Q4RSF8_TETNG|nr:unnamed protein product [Tetraodon nigroviridis]